MHHLIEYSEFENMEESKSAIWIDLRSESEYAKGTISGAISMPVFNDEERAIVGTLYLGGQVEEAKRQGVRIFSKKLPDYYERILELTKGESMVILFCARGGYRSKAIFEAFRALNMNVNRLNGGYKAYRQHLLKNIDRLINEKRYIVLDGFTGCGKTDLLYSLESKGLPVLHLEKMANHRGSLLGHVGLGPQPAQKQFESEIYKSLLEMDQPYVFVEGESPRIGKLMIPKELTKAIRSGEHILVSTSLEKRISNIKKDYLFDDDKELLEAIDSMASYINEENRTKLKKYISSGDYNKAIEWLITRYYDQRYKMEGKTYILEVQNDNVEEATEQLIKLVK
ncbi:MAG: tRNA 2-selenouridine(34) synthase MnmH [Tissierellia bacterium]|nr:tRNA 2-selenouridine(34) synthase MnmH [Tissierellia bacterium]